MLTTDKEQLASRSSSGKTTVDETNDNDNKSRLQHTAFDAESAAALERRPAGRRRGREKDKIWKQQQKEQKAARRAAAAAAASDSDAKSTITPSHGKRVPASRTLKSLLGLLGGSM